MVKTEGKNTISGMFQSQNNPFHYLFILISVSSCLGISKPNFKQEHDLLRYFVQVDQYEFIVNTSYQILTNGDININHLDDYNIVSITTNNKGSKIKISRKTDRKLLGLKISFYDTDNTLRNIQINFYSKIININQLDIGQEVIFDKSKDIVPPLFIMNSLQVGRFIICRDKKIVKNFELLKDLYFFSITAKKGKYGIGEIKCENNYFSFFIK